MLTLIVMATLIPLFVILAVRNWSKAIGAGPTILIVGALFLLGFFGLQYAYYQNSLRSYDDCVHRVERTVAGQEFNNALIDILSQKLEGGQDVADQLHTAQAPSLTPENCGEEPTFLDSTTRK